MPLGMSEFYLYSLNLAMLNLLTYLSKHIYLIGFNNNLPN